VHNLCASIDIIQVTLRDCDGGEKTALKKQRVSLRGVSVCGVNSKVTKHSDYFFGNTRQSAWLDAMTTPVDRKRVNQCVLKHQIF